MCVPVLENGVKYRTVVMFILITDQQLKTAEVNQFVKNDNNINKYCLFFSAYSQHGTCLTGTRANLRV